MLGFAGRVRDILVLIIMVVPPANAGTGALFLPEPGALALFGAAVLFTGLALRRRRTRSAGGGSRDGGTVNQRRSEWTSDRADRKESAE